jgi:hypothetical protein
VPAELLTRSAGTTGAGLLNTVCTASASFALVDRSVGLKPALNKAKVKIIAEEPSSPGIRRWLQICETLILSPSSNGKNELWREYISE